MKLKVIEESCTAILAELNAGSFSRSDLEFLLTFFSKLTMVTSDKLKVRTRKGSDANDVDKPDTKSGTSSNTNSPDTPT